MHKYLCIHGHYYQPPRENAWLEEIELQESANPYHDWNERITAECYAPNAFSRILDDEHYITNIVNNYARTSFNFGATLLSWLEEKEPDTYQAILDADKISQELFGGHGSAIAQVYNHIIMPLANQNDKQTQIEWGIKDFRHRFGRMPEGMWLAETAVDLQTLETLVDNNITFTILAPRQAKKYTRIGSKDWKDGIDTKQAYLCRLPSNRTIILFFYDGKTSQKVAFEGILENGKRFAHSLIDCFDSSHTDSQLVHIATDGETYGHHHRYGDMALAYCLDYIEKNELAKLTNYSQYLNLVETQYEVEIHENSSWSCVHGIERWRDDCGCNGGGGQGQWNQKWRKPLRESLNWLRDELSIIFEEELKSYNIENPWTLRNQYVEIVLDRSAVNVDAFLLKNTGRKLENGERTKILRMLEMQRHALLMFTSCGWFFDEISGIETIQIMQYANRAIQLAESETEKHLETEFLKRLSIAKSNVPEYGTATDIYKRLIAPARLSLTKVGMHYAVASLFAAEPKAMSILNYDAESHKFERLEAGLQKIAAGQTLVHSKITLSKKQFTFAVIYLGQHNIIGYASDKMNSQEFDTMLLALKNAFQTSNIALMMSVMQYHFSENNFSFWDLFKDEQLKVINQILETNVQQANDSNRKTFDMNYNLLSVMRTANLLIPSTLKNNLDIVVNQQLKNFFEQKYTGIDKLIQLAEETKKWSIELDTKHIAFLAEQRLREMICDFAKHKPDESLLLQKIQSILVCLKDIKIEVELNTVQEILFTIGKNLLPQWSNNSEHQNVKSKFLELCETVNMKLDF